MQFSFVAVNIWKFVLFEQLFKKLLIVLCKSVWSSISSELAEAFLTL